MFLSGSVTELTVSGGGVVDWVGGQIGALSLQAGGAVITQSPEATSAYVDGAGDLILASGGTQLLDIPLSGEPAGISFHLQPLSGYVAAVAGSIASVGAGSAVQGLTLGVGDLLIVSSGGLANDITVSGGVIEVFSGGLASDVTVEAQGQLQVSNGGMAVSTSVGSGGEEVASAGGLLSASLLTAGGSSLVLSGGVERDATIVGTSQTIASGGVESGLTLDGGALVDFGQLYGAVVQSGASISAEGEATSVTLLSARMLDGGETIGVVVGPGSTDMVTAVASATTVEAGGIESAFYDARIAGATILSGGLLSDYEADLSDLGIQSGASLYIVNEFGDWNVVSAGTVLSMTVIAGPLEPPPVSISLTPPISLTVSDQPAGGIEDFDSLLTFGEPLVISGGQTSTGLTIGIGSPVTVLSGGDLVDATIGSAASATLSSASEGRGDAVVSGGLETVLAGAVSADDEISGSSQQSGDGVVSGSILDVLEKRSAPRPPRAAKSSPRPAAPCRAA